MSVTSLVLVGAGLVLAFAGRRYVWLLIAATGFLLAFWLLSLILPANNLATLLLALAAGLAAAFLMRGVSRIILWIAGFVLVGSAAVALGGLFGIEPQSAQWFLTFLAGGLLGIVLATFVHGLGIMIITALGGAAMVTIGLPAWACQSSASSGTWSDQPLRLRASSCSMRLAGAPESAGARAILVKPVGGTYNRPIRRGSSAG